MGTLASELGPHVARFSTEPRVYADANVPAGVIGHLRDRLHWDVLAVVEDDQLRRASDRHHFETAGRLRRTLISLDDDFLDAPQFPLTESPGVIVLSAPNEAGLIRLLTKIDRAFFVRKGRRGRRRVVAQPLVGQTIQVHPDWTHPRLVLRDQRSRRPKRKKPI